MAVERTFSISMVTKRNLTGKINAVIEGAGLRDRAEAREAFATASRGLLRRPQGAAVLQDLVGFMSSGPVVVQVLEGENAVAKYREVPGAALAGSVAPITSRYFATAFSPRAPARRPGPELMNSTRVLKNGRSLWTA